MRRVIKLGGSLLAAQALPACLHALQRYSGQILLVPGGGIFADQVRTAQAAYHFTDLAAHRMAILAMQQMSMIISSFDAGFCSFDSVQALPEQDGVAIWLPQIAELDAAGIAASWDITSDSLAAWLAGQVQADELILVKSAEIPHAASLMQLQKQGIIDPVFQRYAAGVTGKISIINKDSFINLI